MRTTSQNPLLAPWSGPYGGVPPFDRVSLADLETALELAMREQLAEVDAIARERAPATFESTIAALERTGRALERAGTIFHVLSSSRSTSEFQALEQRLAPELAAHADRITQNAGLFARIEDVYERRGAAGLTPEQERLTWLTYTTFVRAGAKLAPDAKARLSAINQRLATLFASFSQALLGEESAYELVLEREEDLAGLPASFRAAAAAAASARGHHGRWAVLNTRSSMEPFLTYSARRDLREKVWRTYYSRGDHGDARDTKATLAEILRLRTERAHLLGYATHAHWRLEQAMAKTPERALGLLRSVWPHAVARVREEVADMQALADRESRGRRDGERITIEPWDYRYYAEKVRQERYDLDQNALTPYLQLEELRTALFWVAGELFGLRFTPASGVPVLEPDVRVYEVLDARGVHVGLWYFDPYAREGKRSGAWMSAYRRQERFDGRVATIVSNNTNFVPAPAGEPILVSWDDATTMFHEFGHALHGLLSNVSYPTLSGTAVPNDYVEFPSQVLERWLETPQVLSRFARHHRTGEPLPRDLVDRLQRASRFNQGFATVEYLAAALVDMELHLAASPTDDIDPARFERETLAQLGMPREIVMRHRTTQFSHVFSSDDYSAGYYAYLWADVLAADAWEAFLEAAGPYDGTVAARLLECVFSAGNTRDPAQAYRAFRGRDPDPAALLRKRGFAPR